MNSAVSEQQRGARVPEVVKPYLRQPRPLEQGLEAVRGDVVTVQNSPDSVANMRPFSRQQITRLVYLP